MAKKYLPDDFEDDLAPYLLKSDKKKKKKKKRKYSSEESEEIIQMLGGKKLYKEFGEGIEQYIQMMRDTVIMEALTPDEYLELCNVVEKMAKDMQKGETYMLDYDAVVEYAESMDRILSSKVPR